MAKDGGMHIFGDGNMSDKYKRPNFATGKLELRYDDNIVCIYGTKEGLMKLSEMCQKLINNPQTNHIHLEDYEILTSSSLFGSIAIFDS